MSLVAPRTLMGTSVLNILFTLIDLGLNFVVLKTKMYQERMTHKWLMYKCVIEARFALMNWDSI